MKTITLTLILMMSLFGGLSGKEPLKEGDALPESLEVTLQDGSTIDLGKEMQEGLTFLFFYPKALTPGCTNQACSLRDEYEEIQKRGVSVYGVSLDKVELQAKFKESKDLPYPLIADTEKKVVEAFGVPAKWVASRQCYLVEDGKVIWADHKAATSKQAEELLAVLDKRAE